MASSFYYKRCGDFFLANDLRLGLEKLGYEVEYRFREDYEDGKQIEFGDAGNVIYFKGYYVFDKLPKDDNEKRKTFLYVYYMEGLKPQLFDEVDMVVGASATFVENYVKTRGKSWAVIPQFTNPDRFKIMPKDDSKKTEVLFVGSNNYKDGRESVQFAIDAGADLSVYGKRWEDKLDKKYLKGEFIDNDELFGFYQNAKIVLNDHREEMRVLGFLSNRVYDVSASGGFLLTDYVEEIEKIYGDSIVMYKDFDDFKKKLKYYLENEDERIKKVMKAREITLREFTNVEAAKKFDIIFNSIVKN